MKIVSYGYSTDNTESNNITIEVALTPTTRLSRSYLANSVTSLLDKKLLIPLYFSFYKDLT